jgi:murein DD-endopeptidase MepM/ murein hydrolase activator NlpD
MRYHTIMMNWTAVYRLGDFLWGNRKQLLRTTLAACLVQAVLGGLVPRSAPAPRTRAAVQNGIGGGSTLEKVISESSEAAFLAEDQDALIAGVREPESFSRPRMLLYGSYIIQKGDIIGDLADGFGLSQDTLFSANGIRNSRLIQIGQRLKIPNQDGILHTVQAGDTLEAIAGKYSADAAAIQIANELFSDSIRSVPALFIPGARLGWAERQEINGDLFIWPVAGFITSHYGYRNSPFSGGRQFHSGLDIGAAEGTAVKAAVSGRVIAVGWDDILGNYAVISHHSGYRTQYGHMSQVSVKPGAYVGTGERIGSVGSTGLSTGPHLHFTVYKNGITVNPRTLIK